MNGGKRKKERRNKKEEINVLSCVNVYCLLHLLQCFLIAVEYIAPRRALLLTPTHSFASHTVDISLPYWRVCCGCGGHVQKEGRGFDALVE